VSRITRFLFLSITLILSTKETAYAQISSYQELQAAYIYNFAKYIKWPGEAEAFVIGVYDDEEVMNLLKAVLSEKKIGGREIELKMLTKSADLTGCNIVYVPERGSRYVSDLSDSISGRNILLVTEEDMIKKGAMISFVVEDEKLRFKLKKTSLASAGLVASDGLLKLAIVQ
jgi:hypothetical protein